MSFFVKIWFIIEKYDLKILFINISKIWSIEILKKHNEIWENVKNSMIW